MFFFVFCHMKIRKNALTDTILHTSRLIAKMRTAYYPKYFEIICKTSDEMLDLSFLYIRNNMGPRFNAKILVLLPVCWICKNPRCRNENLHEVDVQRNTSQTFGKVCKTLYFTPISHNLNRELAHIRSQIRGYLYVFRNWHCMACVLYHIMMAGYWSFWHALNRF